VNRAYDLAESRTAGNDIVGMCTARQNKGMKPTKGDWSWSEAWWAAIATVSRSR
jgi:hypothetical protein